MISADMERCRRVAEGLECGIVWVNCSQPCFCQVRACCLLGRFCMWLCVSCRVRRLGEMI